MREALLLQPRGLADYAASYDAMHELAERRLRGEIPDALVLLEHPPVYTAGRRSQPEHVVWSRERIDAAGAEFFEVDRGGSLTFHGPGQLVGYPIVDLGTRPDVIGHLRRIEETLIIAASRAGVALHRDRATGVWAGSAKVAAIGIKVIRSRVTLHGFGLNCETDLSWFDAIVPCGLVDRSVTSLSDLAGRRVTVDEMRPSVASSFEEVFGVELSPPPDALEMLFAREDASVAAR
jgi:lipoyl(octanoyl) transferase